MNQQNNPTCAVSIVIPVYHSETILPRLVEQIHEEMKKCNLDGRFELILVNDCSPDNSWQVITSLAETHVFIKGIALRRNFGQHNATMAGLHQASGESVIIMDDDLQHPPQFLSRMLQKLEEGYDVCYTRYLNRQHVLWKKAGSMLNDCVATWLLNKPKGLYLSSFKALRLGVVKEVIKYDGPYAYLDGLILDATRSIAVVDIQHQARWEGKGNYNLRRAMALYMGMATSFSVTPLRVASYFGIIFAGTSMCIMLYIMVQKILHPEIQAGWTSIVATLLFIGGVQTLCIGMIGEYLGRAYLKINHKPQFTIGKEVGQGCDVKRDTAGGE